MVTSRRVLLLCTTALAALQHQRPCRAFPSPSSRLTSTRSFNVGTNAPRHVSFRKNVASSRIDNACLFGRGTDDVEDRSRPKIVIIKTHDDYVKFLEEDDRLCIIKFYAHWCKSCQKFGVKYRHLAFEEADRIDARGDVVHRGEVRFAEAEYTASAKLCKSLRVRKLPTVHMFRRGEGKVSDLTCKPSMFHLVEGEVRRLMDGGPAAALAEVRPEETKRRRNDVADAALETKMKRNDVTKTVFDGLADEIMTSLKKKGRRVGERARGYPVGGVRQAAGGRGRKEK